MESLSETKWDVVISGTGLQNSLLALALSRSDKKILHVDQNEYYGGAEAAFSLQDVDELIEKAATGTSSSVLRNTSVWRAEIQEGDQAKLSFSRAYTLTLSPQIIYSKSKLLAQLVSSKVYKQLEFQAVGNWWILDGGVLRRLPNGREDIFQDKSIDNKSKRGLMKFLKFVIDFESQPETWEAYAADGLGPFLSEKFQLPQSLQNVITALTLSLQCPSETPLEWALPRIARHLTSIGVFGPGFGSVIPKWGGGSEIAQVACRAGAVGGGIYILGTGVKQAEKVTEEDGERVAVTLSNGEQVRTRRLVDSIGAEAGESVTVSKLVAVVSSHLSSLFQNTVEGSPLSAVSVITFPPGSISTPDTTQTHPIYIMAHSSDTGECPAGQCILYLTTLHSNCSKALLEAAASNLLSSIEDGPSTLLYTWYYEQSAKSIHHSSLDLAFNDEILKNVEQEWRKIVGEGEDVGEFMKFEERNVPGEEDEDAESY